MLTLLIATGVTLAGCVDAGTAGAEAPTLRPSPSIETPERLPTPSPSEGDPREAEYDAEVAGWPEPLPTGYSWPKWADLPHIEADQLQEMDNASGVYRCILVNAAWRAYFEDNDPVASKDYASRADAYLVPENPSSLRVTEDGIIIDSNLAAMSGICRGIAGSLP